MDAFFARLKHPDLAPALDDGLVSTFLTRVDFDPGVPEQLRLTFSLRGRTWPGEQVREDWEVTADGVALQVLQLGRCPELRLLDDHPLLEEWRAEWGILRGLNLPPEPQDIENLLLRFEAWAPPLSNTSALIHTPDGLPAEAFASGPLGRLQQLQTELIRHGLEVQLRAQGKLLAAHGGPLRLLHLGQVTPLGPRTPEALVLARSFHAAPLP